MKVRALFPLAAAAGFWLAGPSLAQQPATLPSSVSASTTNPNQALADAIAARLRATNVTDRRRHRHRRDGRQRHADRIRQGCQPAHPSRPRGSRRDGRVRRARWPEGRRQRQPRPDSGPRHRRRAGCPTAARSTRRPAYTGPGPIVEPAPLGVPARSRRTCRPRRCRRTPGRPTPRTTT